MPRSKPSTSTSKSKAKSTSSKSTPKTKRPADKAAPRASRAKSAAPAPRADPIRPFAVAAAQLLSDRHCEDICLLDVRGLSHVCDYVLVATGTSDRQMRSVAAELEDVGEEAGHKVFRTSRDDASTWIVIDFVDMVVHLFEPNQRAYYDIESLWADSQSVNWRREAESTAPASRTSSPKARRTAR